MPHVSINGVTVPGDADDFEEAGDYVAENTERGVNGSLQAASAGRARACTVSTTPMTAAKGEALRSLVEGEGQAWRFDDSLFSAVGVGPSSSTGCTQSASGGKYAGKLAITSTNRFEVTLTKRMSKRGGWDATKFGWTVIVWKKITVGDGGDGTSYFHHIITGAVAVVRGASANPAGVAQYRNGGAAGSFGAGNWLSVTAAGVVAVHAYDNAGAGAAFDYCGLVVLPFVMPAEWVAGIYAHQQTWPWSKLPRVGLLGDAVPDAAPVEVIGRARKVKQVNVQLEGSHRNNARVLELEFKEW